MLLKKILMRGCVWYTLLITALYTLGVLSGPTEQWIPTLRVAYALLGFSMGISVAHGLIGLLRCGFGGKLVLHFVTSALLYYVTFVLGGGFAKDGGTTFAALLIFLAVYAILTVVLLIARRLIKDRAKSDAKKNSKGSSDQKNDDYQPMFRA